MIHDRRAADAKDDRYALERRVEMSCVFFGHGVSQLPSRYALHVTQQSAKIIDFVTSTGAVACTVAFPDGSWAFGNFDITIAQQLLELDASRSKAQMFL